MLRPKKLWKDYGAREQRVPSLFGKGQTVEAGNLYYLHSSKICSLRGRTIQKGKWQNGLSQQWLRKAGYGLGLRRKVSIYCPQAQKHIFLLVKPQVCPSTTQWNQKQILLLPHVTETGPDTFCPQDDGEGSESLLSNCQIKDTLPCRHLHRSWRWRKVSRLWTFYGNAWVGPADNRRSWTSFFWQALCPTG